MKMNNQIQANLKREYFSVPRGYTPIRKSAMFSRYCIKVLFSGDICYFDRLTGKTVTEQEIRENMKYLDTRYNKVLSEFFDKYPKDEDKKLFWATRMQRSSRTYTKKFARELKEEIERKRLMANG
jgi:hypothetical protein